jgi:hypothetical protein
MSFDLSSLFCCETVTVVLDDPPWPAAGDCAGAGDASCAATIAEAKNTLAKDPMTVRFMCLLLLRVSAHKPAHADVNKARAMLPARAYKRNAVERLAGQWASPPYRM